MSHSISGIITSFKYKGDLPHLYLVGNYAFIPLDSHQIGFRGNWEAPFYELTSQIKKLGKDLSFCGKCAFIETDFFGGAGTQKAIVWENGKKLQNPLVSYHNLPDRDRNYYTKKFVIVDEAINETLRLIGIKKHLDKDEFDTARLGYFRNNKDVFDEIKIQQSQLIED